MLLASILPYSHIGPIVIHVFCLKTGMLLTVILSHTTCSHILFLFYPMNLEGRRGTTDEFTTVRSTLACFSAALLELA